MARRPRALPLVTRPQVALCLGVHAITISKWEAHDGLPVEQRGGPGKPTKYALPKVIAWALARERAKYAVADGPSLDADRARLARAQAERNELYNAERRGALIVREQAIREGRVVVGAVRARLLALPRQCVQRGLVPTSREADVRALILEALTELAQWRLAEAERVAGTLA
jgi:phage terminase Nu1 subunit (DNA packaging protein)